MSPPRLLERIIDAAIARRALYLGALAGLTLFLGAAALKVKVEAPHEKFIPGRHPYVLNYERFSDTFGRTNVVVFALMPTSGTIYEPGFLRILEEATMDI